MNNYPDDTFLARWLNGELSESEMQEFSGTEDQSELERLLLGVGKLAPQTFEEERLIAQIKQRIAQKQDSKRKVRRLNTFLMAAAATVLLLLAAWYFWPKGEIQPQYALYEVNTADKPVQASFPDGSTFALNKSSKIEFDQANWGVQRKVKLEGEAYFEVKKGAAFIVSSSRGKVRVVGTKFNVTSRENFFQVECFEGKVEVSGAGFEMKILSKGQMYRPIPQQQIPVDSMLRQMPEESRGEEWLDGITQLIDRSLSQIAQEFQAHYGIQIVLHDGLADNGELHSTVIPHDKLELAIKTTFNSLHIEGKLIEIDTSKLETNKQIDIFRGNK